MSKNKWAFKYNEAEVRTMPECLQGSRSNRNHQFVFNCLYWSRLIYGDGSSYLWNYRIWRNNHPFTNYFRVDYQVFVPEPYETNVYPSDSSTWAISGSSRAGPTKPWWKENSSRRFEWGRPSHMPIYGCENPDRMIFSTGYGSIPIDTFLVGWTSIYQLFWCSLGTRVLTHPQLILSQTCQIATNWNPDCVLDPFMKWAHFEGYLSHVLVELFDGQFLVLDDSSRDGFPIVDLSIFPNSESVGFQSLAGGLDWWHENAGVFRPRVLEPGTWKGCKAGLPSGKQTKSYWKWPIFSGSTY